MKSKISIAFLLLLLSGCSSVALTHDEVVKADFGQYPENYKSIVKNWFEELLKDPESARYKFDNKPIKAYTRNPPVEGGGVVHFGYYVKVKVNAKNSFGGYTGWQEYRLLIRNGKVIDNFIANMYFKEPWYQ